MNSARSPVKFHSVSVIRLVAARAAPLHRAVRMSREVASRGGGKKGCHTSARRGSQGGEEGDEPRRAVGTCRQGGDGPAGTRGAYTPSWTWTATCSSRWKASSRASSTDRSTAPTRHRPCSGSRPERGRPPRPSRRRPRPPARSPDRPWNRTSPWPRARRLRLRVLRSPQASRRFFGSAGTFAFTSFRGVSTQLNQRPVRATCVPPHRFLRAVADEFR